MKKILVAVVLFFLTVSCSSELDFDQTGDIVLQPRIEEVPLVDAKYQAPDFLDIISQLELPDINFESEFAISTGDFFIDDVEQLIIELEVENGIDRDFLIELNFLDRSGGEIPLSREVLLEVEPNTSGIEVFTYAQPEVSLFSRVRNISLTLIVAPQGAGQVITSSTTGIVKVRSSLSTQLNLEL